MNVVRALEGIKTDGELRKALADVADAWLKPAQIHAQSLTSQQLLMERICAAGSTTIERKRLEAEMLKLPEAERFILEETVRKKYKRNRCVGCSCVSRHRKRATAQNMSSTATPTAADILTG